MIKEKIEHEVLADIVLVRYGELALKSSGIRNWYEKLLMKNIAAMLRFISLLFPFTTH